MEYELLEHGRKLIEQIRSECRSLLEDENDQRYAEESSMDGMIANNYDLAAVLWASGLLSDALSAVYEDLETYIFDPVRE